MSVLFWVVIFITIILRLFHFFNMRTRFHQASIARRMQKEANWQMPLGNLPPFYLWMCIEEFAMLALSCFGLGTSQMVAFMVIILSGFVPCHSRVWFVFREILVVVLLIAALANRIGRFVALPTVF